MNPEIINSANVEQFGFSATFNLLTKKVLIDIDGMTVLGSSGTANISSISFSGENAIGMSIGQISMNLGTLAPVELNMGGLFDFGFYTVTGKIIDTSGNSYEVKVSKEICRPVNWDDGLKQAKGIYEIRANCNTAKATVYDRTEYSYLKKTPAAKSVTGKLFYPNNTLQEEAISFTPFSVGGAAGLYTGTYRVSAQTLATYELGDGISVVIPYKTVYENTVECSGSLRNIICCLEEVYSGMGRKNSKGYSDNQAINDIAPYLLLAIIKDQNGKSTEEEVKIIRDRLNCDCGCGENGLMEPALIGSDDNVMVEGSGATSVEATSSGGSTLYTVHSKLVSVTKSSPSDPSLTLNKTETDNGIVYAIGFNYEALTTTILNTIQGNNTLLSILNQFISIGYTNNLVGLDGGTIIDLTKCSYSFNEIASGKIIKSILIGSIVYTAPSSLQLNDQGAVSTWLNGLGKGSFVVGYDVPTLKTSITSTANVNVVSEIKLTVGSDDIDIAFSRSCPTLKDILQSIFDYLEALNTSQIKLKTELKICLTPGSEGVDPTYDIFAIGTPLENFLVALNTKICALVQTAGKGPKGDPGDDGRSVKVVVQPGQPVGTFMNGDIWIVG